MPILTLPPVLKGNAGLKKLRVSDCDSLQVS